MKDSIKDLKKLITLCRKEGVQALKLGDIEFHLSPVAPEKKRINKAQAVVKMDLPKVENEVSEEDLLFWSSTTPGMENQLNG